MNKTLIVVGVAALFLSCQAEEKVPKTWTLQKSIPLDGVNPIGIAQVDGSLWLSDGDHNRLVRISEQGKIVSVVDSLERPMHIDASDGVLFVPLYGEDEVFSYHPQEPENQLPEWSFSNDSLDAPAGVSVFHQEKAVADFYNNRILYNNGSDWISFGKKGKGEGEFYYPTDVQITEDKIWVADAYNNRVQVFDKKGNFLQMMGQDQKMNAATGIFVSDSDVFVTDFENNRVLVFDREGNLKQEIKDGVAKPTDILVWQGILYVINYRDGSISTFKLSEKPSLHHKSKSDG